MACNNAKGKYQVDTTTSTFNHLEAEPSQIEYHSHTVSQTTLRYVSVYMAGFCLCSRLFFVARLFCRL